MGRRREDGTGRCGEVEVRASGGRRAADVPARGEVDGRSTYLSKNGASPDKYRLGAIYVGMRNYRMGWEGESIRVSKSDGYTFLVRGRSCAIRCEDDASELQNNSSGFYPVQAGGRLDGLLSNKEVNCF